MLGKSEALDAMGEPEKALMVLQQLREIARGDKAMLEKVDGRMAAIRKRG